MKNTLKLAAVAASIFAATASHAANYVVAQCAAEQNGIPLSNVQDRFLSSSHVIDCIYSGGDKYPFVLRSYYGATATNPETHAALSYHWKIDDQNNYQGKCEPKGNAKNCQFYKPL